MKRIRFRENTGARGFTLVEILIVAALIALFSGIAIMSISYLSTQAKRKAAVADARSISDALTITKFEFRFYPKLCFLSLPKTKVQEFSGTRMQILPDFDYQGFDTVTNRVLLPRSQEILSKWRGPYFPSPQGRGLVATARAGVCKVRLPYQDRNTPSAELYDWPADPWGNPYVVYLVKSQTVNNAEQISWITSPFDEPVYFARVVSYGPNGIPGGAADELLPGGLKIAAEPYKLYIEEDDHFLMLTPDQYSKPVERVNALYSTKAPFAYLKGTEFAGKIPGIMDIGSDDLTVPLH